jgi:hypothetical protein
MEYNNRGILFRNFRKKQPRHPDFIGEATIDGRKFKLAGWTKPGKRGEFHSLAFTEEKPPSEEAPRESGSHNVPDSAEDEQIPF